MRGLETVRLLNTAMSINSSFILFNLMNSSASTAGSPAYELIPTEIAPVFEYTKICIIPDQGGTLSTTGTAQVYDTSTQSDTMLYSFPIKFKWSTESITATSSGVSVNVEPDASAAARVFPFQSTI